MILDYFTCLWYMASLNHEKEIREVENHPFKKCLLCEDPLGQLKPCNEYRSEFYYDIKKKKDNQHIGEDISDIVGETYNGP